MGFLYFYIRRDIMKRRIMVLLLSAATAMSMLSGCGETPSQTVEETAQEVLRYYEVAHPRAVR